MKDTLYSWRLEGGGLFMNTSSSSDSSMLKTCNQLNYLLVVDYLPLGQISTCFPDFNGQASFSIHRDAEITQVFCQ